LPLASFFFGIEVVETAEEFVEPVHGGEVFVAIALVVFTELACGVALGFEDGGHGDVGFLPAFFGTGHADFGHA
jgi:hypothetical protein